MQDIAMDKAMLVAFILETLFYGFYSILFIATLFILYHNPCRRQKFTLFTNCLLYALTTAHWSTQFVRTILAFSGHGGAAPGGAQAYLSDLSNPLNIIASIILSAQTMLADTFIIFRLHRICSRRYIVIIFPSLLLITTGIAGFGLSYQLATSAPATTTIFLPRIKPWILAFFTITLTNSILCTSIIAYRIRQGRRTHSVQTSTNLTTTTVDTLRLRRAMILVLSSCALYACTLLALIIACASHSNGYFVVLGLVMPIIGIGFCLVLFSAGCGGGTLDIFNHHRRSYSSPSHSVQLREMRADVRFGGIECLPPSSASQYPNHSPANSSVTGHNHKPRRLTLTSISFDKDLAGADAMQHAQTTKSSPLQQHPPTTVLRPPSEVYWHLGLRRGSARAGGEDAVWPPADASYLTIV